MTTLSAEKVALFYNAEYVQIDEGNLFAEGSNMLASLEAEGHEVNLFSDISVDAFSKAILESDLLIIPELERRDLFADMDDSMIQMLKNYIKNGGGLIICGVVAPNEANSTNALKILNGIFDFSLKADAISLSGMSDLSSNEVTGTAYDSTPNSIVNNNSIAFLTGGFPNGSKSVYRDTNDNNNTTVALLPYGEGEIAYLGWGWWNAAPNGAQDNGWMEVLEASIDQVACTNPEAVVKQGASVQLGEDGTIELKAADFDNGSTACTSDFTLDISPKFFDCDDLGTHTLTFTITDLIGRTTVKSINIELKDDAEYCKTVELFNIIGDVKTATGESVNEVAIMVKNNGQMKTFTGEDGHYEFNDIESNQDYNLVPQKDVEPLNGITTFDILLIGKHIMGIEEFDSPYKMLAADVNKSGSITTADMVELRRMVLYLQLDFANNESWRFVEKTHSFTNPINPLVESLPESYNIENIAENTQIDFVAIKVGDVNASVNPNRYNSSTDRSANQILTLTTDDKTMNKGDFLSVEFSTRDLNNKFFGCQFSLDFDASAMTYVGFESEIISAGEFVINSTQDGLLHISWANPNGVTVSEEEALFTLQFEANNSATLSEVMEMSTRYLQAEAYTDNNELNDLTLEFTTEDSQSAIATNEIIDFELHQNFPNPFMDRTTIGFDLAEAADVVLTVFDLAGRTVYTTNSAFQAGYNTIELQAQDLESGMLIYQLATPNASITKRMMVATK